MAAARSAEWVLLIEPCEKAGVQDHGDHPRPAATTRPTDRDRRSLLEDAVDSEYESGKISEPAPSAPPLPQRSTASPMVAFPTATAGSTTRRPDSLIAQEPDPVEAPVVIEMFDRTAAGHSLTSISQDLKARGITSRKGVPFSAPTMRGMLLAPLYAGRRIHSPNRQKGAYRGDPEASYDATWPALVTDETFYAVRARLMDPARTTTRPGRAKHLLSPDRHL